MTFQNAVTAIALIGFAPWFAKLPGHAETWGVVVGGAALGLTASTLFAWAYARAEAQVLVPLEYSAFLWASLFGWLFFAEAVRPTTVVGVVLIVIACFAAAPRTRTEPAAI